MINIGNYVLSLPLILLALFALGTVVMDQLFPPEWKWLNSVTAFVGICFAIGGVGKIQATQAHLATTGIRLQVGFQHAMVVDDFSLFFYYILLVAGALAVLLTVRREIPWTGPPAKFYSALSILLFGLLLMVSGFHLGLIFAGVVISDVGAYAMSRSVAGSLKAQAKFLRWRVISSGTLGLGFLLLRVSTKSAGLHEIRQALAGLDLSGLGSEHRLLGFGVAVTVAGIILRLVAFPFLGSSRNGDAGQTIAEKCANGFFSTAFPAAAWAMALHILLWGLYPLRMEYSRWLMWAAVAAVIVGTLAILAQSTLSRLVAFYSVAAGGFMLLSLSAVASSPLLDASVTNGLKSILVYLPAILLMNLGALAVAAQADGTGQNNEIADLAGLFRRRPLQAFALAIFFLSMAGVPALAGFFGKYYGYLGLTAGGHKKLAGFGIVCALIGLVGAIRVFRIMALKAYATASEGRDTFPGAWLLMLLCAIVTIIAGVNSQILARMADWAIHAG